MTALVDIQQALADQISDALCGTADPAIENLQVTHLLNLAPSPPSVDVYPADDFAAGLTYGASGVSCRLVVRVRVSPAAHEDGQVLLLSMMDWNGDSSMLRAIAGDRTFGGAVSSSAVESQTGLNVFTDAGGAGSLVGSTWIVKVIP